MERTYHPLSTAHYKQIIRRPGRIKRSMAQVWGLTWNLRGHTLRKLGSASMMALSYHYRMIELLCVTAETRPESGEVSYSDIRMHHDFSRNPHPGAQGRVLDPRESQEAGVRRNDRPNASWVQLGLALDKHCERAGEHNWQLPVVPVLPKFLAGFPSMEAVDMELTPALVGDIAAHIGKPASYVRQLSDEDLLSLAKAHWPDLWQAPGTAGNPSSLWLLDVKYTTQLSRAVWLYEDFSELVGVECPNPARNISAAKFPNPTREIAASREIKLDEVLAVVKADFFGDDSPEALPTYSVDEATELLIRVADELRERLAGYQHLIDDDAVNAAVLTPDEPIVVPVTSRTFKALPVSDAICLMRTQLERERPIFSDGVTDDDLMNALEKPHAPLYASRMCQFQALHWDMRLNPEDAFRFTPDVLGRDRVHANLWRDYQAPREVRVDQSPKIEHASA